VHRQERLRINITRDGQTIVVGFIGDLDVYAASDARAVLDDALDRAVAHAVARITIDASRLGFCDSTGLSVFVHAHENARRRGVQLTLIHLSETLTELLALTDLQTLIGGDD
jgi:anti-sigma B factor antagonist